MKTKNKTVKGRNPGKRSARQDAPAFPPKLTAAQRKTIKHITEAKTFDEALDRTPEWVLEAAIGIPSREDLGDMELFMLAYDESIRTGRSHDEIYEEYERKAKTDKGKG